MWGLNRDQPEVIHMPGRASRVVLLYRYTGSMRTSLLACFLLACAVLAGCGSSPQDTFSYEKQVGIAGAQDGNDCLAIFNDSLQPGTKIVLVDQPHRSGYDTPLVSEASILERVSERCDHRLSASHDFGGQESFYTIRTSAAEWQGSFYQIAIINPKQPVSVRDGKVTGDIDGDGTPEFFRNCFSNEGVHYQVWTGVPLERRGRWHWYVYAGYDLEYDCTDKEYFGPK